MKRTPRSACNWGCGKRHENNHAAIRPCINPGSTIALEMKNKLSVHCLLRSAVWAITVALLYPLSAVTGPAISPVWLQGGHASRVSGVACSPDGTVVASASDDATIKLWSTNGSLLKTLNTQPYQATAIAISPDGTKLAAGTYSGGFASGNVGRLDYTNIPGLGRIYLWEAPNGWTATNVNLCRVLTNRFGKINSLAFSADSAWLASGNAAGSNYVYLVSDGSVVTTRSGYDLAVGPATVTSVAFSPAGWLASGCEDSTMCAWNRSWSQVWVTNAAHASNVTAVAFSPNGAWLASASLDQTIRLWSTTNWTSLQTLTGHTEGVTSVAFSPDGQKVVSGSLDGTVKLWNWTDGACLATIAAHAAPVSSTIFLPDGTRVISGSEDCTIRIWSAGDGALVQNLGSQKDYIGTVAISPDGTLCASAGGDPSIQVRRVADGLLLRTLSGHLGGVTAVAFAPDSAVLASSGGPRDPSVKMWRLSDGAVLRSIAANSNGVMALALSPDGTLLASGGDCTEQSIQLWDARSGGLLRILTGHSNGVTALAFSPHGDLLASGGRRFDHAVKIWSVTNGSLWRTFTGHVHNIEAVAFAPDGNTVASGSSGTNSLKVWQLSDGSSRTFGSGTNPVFALAFAPDGATLTSADRDTIALWDVASGRLSETITQETFRVSCLAYSPNGNLFMYGREDATVVMSANRRGALGQPPLVFQTFTVSPDGVATMEAAVQPRTHYVLQSSSNLTDWVFLSRTVSETNSLSIAGPATRNVPAQFHRALTPP